MDTYLVTSYYINQSSGIEYQVLAAVMTEEHLYIDGMISAQLLEQGNAFLHADNLMEKMEWFRAHGMTKEPADLVNQVTEEAPVALGKPKEIRRPPEEVKKEEPYLNIIQLDNVTPLDAQLNTWPQLTVPPSLTSVLFGTDKSLKSYAVVDAAKLQWGHSEIDNCGMPFRCLFKGNAAEELKDSTPYLIELEQESDFTRKLFTYNPMMPEEMTSAHMWHKAAAIFICSTASLEVLWHHLRHFTQLQDEAGERYFFRFYEPLWIADLLKAMGSERAAHFFSDVIERIIAVSPKGPQVAIELLKENIKNKRSLKFDAEFREGLALVKTKEFTQRLSELLAAMLPDFAQLSHEQQSDHVEQSMALAQHHGFHIEKSVGYFSAAAWLKSLSNESWFEKQCQQLSQLNLTESDRAKALFNIAKEEQTT